MKGILFKPEMIKAIMEGRKTQTRRIIKSKHESGLFQIARRKIDNIITAITSLDWNDRPKNGRTGDIQPKYKVGEIIYVKEPYEDYMGAYNYKLGRYGLLGEKWKNAMFMPASAARTFLRITNVRVERLFDITDEDAIAEGIECDKNGELWKDYNTGNTNGFIWPRQSFDSLWVKINGIDNWNQNPYLFVYEFTLVTNPKVYK